MVSVTSDSDDGGAFISRWPMGWEEDEASEMSFLQCQEHSLQSESAAKDVLYMFD